MSEINENLKKRPFYLTKKISEEIDGEPNVVNLGRGQAGFQPSLKIYEEAKRIIDPKDKTLFKYSPATGTKELRESIAHFYGEQFNLDVSPNSIVVTVGGTGAISLSFLALTNPGDEIIIPDPAYPFYELAAKYGLENRVVKRVPIGEGKLTRERLEPIITGKTQLVVLTSPNNPTGVVYDKKTLKGIMELAKEKDFFVFYDENHFPEVYDGKKHLPIQLFDEDKKHSISVGSLSRFALQGDRVGWAILPGLSKDFPDIFSSQTPFANVRAQKLGAFVLDHYKELDFEKIFKEYKEKRDWFIPEINKLEGFECHLPEGTAYAFPNIKGFVDGNRRKIEEVVRNGAAKRGRSKEDIEFALAHNSVLVHKFLLYSVGVGVVPGISYGPNSDDNIRLSFSVKKEEVMEAVDRMKDMYKLL